MSEIASHTQARPAAATSAEPDRSASDLEQESERGSDRGSEEPSAAVPDPGPEGPASEPFDVAVVGAGPAGALAARCASLRGLRTVLIDRASFPRAKVCGCCLHPAGVRALKRAGLGRLLDDLGAPTLERASISARGRTLDLPLDGVRAVARERFDTALVEAAAAAGVETRFHRVARLLEPGDVKSVRTLELRQVARQGETNAFPTLPDPVEAIRAKVVIAADGLGGALLAGVGETPQEVAPESRVGVGATLDAGLHGEDADRVRLAVGSEGYVGTVVLEDGRLDIAAALDPRAMAQHGTPQLVARILEQAGRPVPAGLERLTWRGTPALTRRAKGFPEHPLGTHRAFAIGDAAGYVEPFTGEGMAWALQSALMVQPFAARAVAEWSDGLGVEWAREYERSMGPRRRACARVARIARAPRSLAGAALLFGRSRTATSAMARFGYGPPQRKRGLAPA